MEHIPYFVESDDFLYQYYFEENCRSTAPIFFEKLCGGIRNDDFTIEDIGWSGIPFLDFLGIEFFIGTSGFKSADDFFDAVKTFTNSDLRDWEACQHTVYKNWGQSTFNAEGEYCTYYWSVFPGSEDGMRSEAVRIFALRHKAWFLLVREEERAFKAARIRSCAENVFRIKNRISVITPEILELSNSVGFHIVVEILQEDGSTKMINATWPKSDLRQTLADAHACQAPKDRLYLFENGVCIQLSKLKGRFQKTLLNAYDQNAKFYDLRSLLSFCKAYPTNNIRPNIEFSFSQ